MQPKNKLRKIWNCPVLLLIAHPREDWAPEFKQITLESKSQEGFRYKVPSQDAMNSVRITYAPRTDTEAEAELSALANVYRLILDCSAKRPSPRQSRRHNAIVRNAEGVSHVDRRPN
jgi:hypothetical protein